MSPAEKAKIIIELLDTYIPEPQIPLHHTDRFTLLIAVLLSARCTDERVNRITKDLFAEASTPEAMAVLPLSRIELLIKPCGFYRTKARAILSLSQILIKQFRGEVPGSFPLLESLPGVGHKTASVVMAEGFSIPAFPVDTHIFRSARRWGLSSGKTVEQVEADCKALFPEKSWIRLHLQIILYARKYCPALGHKPECCPICSRLLQAEQALPKL